MDRLQHPNPEQRVRKQALPCAPANKCTRTQVSTDAFHHQQQWIFVGRELHRGTRTAEWPSHNQHPTSPKLLLILNINTYCISNDSCLRQLLGPNVCLYWDGLHDCPCQYCMLLKHRLTPFTAGGSPTVVISRCNLRYSGQIGSQKRKKKKEGKKKQHENAEDNIRGTGE